MWTGYISFKKRMWCKETKDFTGPCMCNVQLAFRRIDKQAGAWNCLHWGRKTTVAYSLIFSVITGYKILSELIMETSFIIFQCLENLYTDRNMSQVIFSKYFCLRFLINTFLHYPALTSCYQYKFWILANKFLPPLPITIISFLKHWGGGTQRVLWNFQRELWDIQRFLGMFQRRF